MTDVSGNTQGYPERISAEQPEAISAHPDSEPRDAVTADRSGPMETGADPSAPESRCEVTADPSEHMEPVAAQSDSEPGGAVVLDPSDATEAAADSPDSAAAVQPSDRPGSAEPTTPPLREADEAALRLAEAVVFASVTPMTARGLSQLLPTDMDPAAVIAALRLRYEGRGIELVEIGGGLRFRTAADLAPRLRKVVQVPRRLPRVALETLAIVAYHQPVTRPEIEDMRGTGLSQQTLDVLLENDLIVARGRKETPGRPTLWGTTEKFLEYFGLRDIRELPRRQDLLLEAVRPEADGEPAAVVEPTASDAREG